MQLTPHFTLEELTRSDTARARQIDNTPSPAAAANLRRLAQTLERVRALLGGKPMQITSGYRSPALNRAVGGVSTSAHAQGLAADFVCSGYGPPVDVCRALAASDLPFDQVINEFGRWVHIGLAADGVTPRRQVLTARKVGGRTTYAAGLHA
ncbi:peptidase M15 [Burkholderia ubonensis]|uniref:Peptidase M15 n=1 Tax=Burkholderia ubonensis TaxID=101571 RepID=A0A102K8B6_9BURK|nr:D-Ala-D-Ala carboxypeptidase family metallohydrolase [Burkholderia ubonensis]KUZ70659.1 peptidase M15 [Burkholderia ubonensis]KUZ80989.1 peptidase M15 [Burkholderia ubonensis]KUZ87422.1 peptidase M15 [Burkholderia ubonensis]